MEFASFFNSLGTEVTVVEMLPEILGGLDGEISAMLRDIYAKKGIKFNLSCRVTEIKGNEVIYVDPQGNTASAKGDKILVSVGRRAVTAGLGLETLGVELNRGAVKVDNKMRTNVPNVFAAGDVTGFSMLAHTASREGEVVVNNLTGRPDVRSGCSRPPRLRGWPYVRASKSPSRRLRQRRSVRSCASCCLLLPRRGSAPRLTFRGPIRRLPLGGRR